jgi:hypothetical protein
MHRVVRSFVVLLLLSLAPPASRLSAQIFSGLGDARPGEDFISLGVVYGQMNPQTRFRDGGGFDSSSLIGGSATFWLNRFMGLQFSVVFSEHKALLASDGRESIVSGRDPSVQTYQGDFVLRYPLPAGAVTVSPYAAIGGGWKYYNWTWDSVGGRNSRGMDGAWSYVGGLEARFGAQHRFGVRGEFRDLRSRFVRNGEDLTHKDRVLSGGLLLNL